MENRERFFFFSLSLSNKLSLFPSSKNGAYGWRLFSWLRNQKCFPSSLAPTPTHPPRDFLLGVGRLPLVHSFIHTFTKFHWKTDYVHSPTHLSSGWPSGTRLSAPTNPTFLLAPFLGTIRGLGAQAEPPPDPSLPGGSLRTSSPRPRAPKSQAWEHREKAEEAGTPPLGRGAWCLPQSLLLSLIPRPWAPRGPRPGPSAGLGL